jgi:hypothetical protein
VSADEARREVGLEQVWIDRFHADLERDERQERWLLIKAIVVGLIVLGVAWLRWRVL